MRVKAYAKLNLTLDILRKRPDGYHDLQMIMQSIDLADELTVVPAKGQGNVTTSLHYLPSDERNLARQAAQVFRERTGSRLRVDISIQKHIPVCAGMGGGSSDAAAVLRALNELAGTGLSPQELAQIGETVGSDVPYCVLGGTALAEGRGERLRALPSLPPCWVVVCKPPFSIPTPQLFGRVNLKKIIHRPDTDGLILALNHGNLEDAARRLYNVFEDVLDPISRTDINSIKSTLINYGALGASMTGSGPAVFGLFDDKAAAQQARDVLDRSWESVFLCRTL